MWCLSPLVCLPSALSSLPAFSRQGLCSVVSVLPRKATDTKQGFINTGEHKNQLQPAPSLKAMS